MSHSSDNILCRDWSQLACNNNPSPDWSWRSINNRSTSKHWHFECINRSWLCRWVPFFTLRRRFNFFAAIISFLAAFRLILYKLTVAQKGEKIEENLVHSLKPKSLNDPGRSQTTPYADNLLRPVRRPFSVKSPLSGDKVIGSTISRLVQVGPFQRPPPTELLARCHSLCIFLSFFGFLLVLVGSISFTWDQLPRSIAISTSISMVFCLVAATLIIIFPSTKTSHIFLWFISLVRRSI